jgi:hypothetical protein
MTAARLSVPLIALGLALAPAATPALAKKTKGLGPVVTVAAKGNTASGTGQRSTATARCPSGKLLVGGGFTSPPAQGAALIVHDSYRSSPTAWTVGGVIATGAGSSAVTAHAYCRKAKGRPVSDVSTSASLAGNGEIKTLSPSCSTGRLIGGGFQSTLAPSGTGYVFPQVNQAASPNTWTVTGVAADSGPRTLTAHAYCMPKIKAPKIRSQTTAYTVGQFGNIAISSPACPPLKRSVMGKKRAIPALPAAGGFSAPVNSSPTAPVMVFGESHAALAGVWVVNATNAYPATGVVPVTSQAICF